MIEIANIDSGYGKKTVLHGLSLTFKEGEVLSVVGPNGSGKSTLFKTVSGIIATSRGDIIIDGVSASRLTSRQRALKISYLPQESAIPDMSVYDCVLQGRYPHVGVFGGYGKRDRCVAERIMEKMGLSVLSDKKMSELSGGMRRRVHIASALAEESDHILLDEPCAYLDVGAKLELMSLLKTLARSLKKAVVLVIHDLPLAFNVSDRIAVIKDGVCVIADTPDAVLKSGCVKDVFGAELVKTSDGYCLSYKQISQIGVVL